MTKVDQSKIGQGYHIYVLSEDFKLRKKKLVLQAFVYFNIFNLNSTESKESDDTKSSNRRKSPKRMTKLPVRISSEDSNATEASEKQLLKSRLVIPL